jgi:hypothetical protein
MTIITTITIKAITTGLTAIMKPVYTGLVFNCSGMIRESVNRLVGQSHPG